jgi:hypothetical protein
MEVDNPDISLMQTNNNEEQGENDPEPEADVGGGAEDRKLGRLFFTIKYSFEKNALVVTVNKCTNLPAKDAQNKSR